jgi:hypothetical protein
MLLLSSVYYVFEVERSVTKSEATETTMTTQAITVNTMVSALANFTNGGDRLILTTNLNKLSLFLKDHSYYAQQNLQFTPLNSSPYQEGIWTSWDSSGTGISSAYINFVVNSSTPSKTYSSQYNINITTTLTLEAVFVGSEAEKSVNLTCRISNEGKPALAEDITILYQNEPYGPWTMVNSSNNLNIVDYGNGTYFITFNAYAQSFLQVSVEMHDRRDIFVMARALCLNANDVTNILDAIMMSYAFGSTPADPNWNPDADLNGDGVVNILDMILLGLSFGART